MRVLVEPRVDLTKLNELLDIGTEKPELDFKRTLDLGDTRDKVELAKDVGAMMAEGGFIVVGADDSGGPVGDLTDQQLAQFDESKLRGILGKWISEVPELLIGKHEVDGCHVVVVYVPPCEQCLNIFKADGQYSKQQASGKPKQVAVFRKGDVFVRDGTSSTRWQHKDIARITGRMREREKERWLTEFMHDYVAAQEKAIDAQQIATSPATALDWRLDEATFDQVVVEQLRRGDEIPLMLLVERLPAAAEEVLGAGNLEDYEVLLNRVTCLASLAVRLERRDWLVRVLEVLVRIYGLTFFEGGGDRPLHRDCPLPYVRLALIARVMGVGALAVRHGDWTAVRELVLRYPAWMPQRKGLNWNWIRHAQVNATRAKLFVREDQFGRTIEVGLISEVSATARQLSCLHPDVSAQDPERSTDLLLTSILQFDALAMLTVYGRHPGSDRGIYYPNFCRYEALCLGPALERLLDDPEMRAALYPGDDQALAADMSRMFDFAAEEGVRYIGGGVMLTDRIAAFLRDHGFGVG